jgi:hypothetical protein
LQGFFAAQGLQGFFAAQGFLDAQGLHGLFAAQGLHGLLPAQGLQGLLAAQGLHAASCTVAPWSLAAAAGRVMAPPRARAVLRATAEVFKILKLDLAIVLVLPVDVLVLETVRDRRAAIQTADTMANGCKGGIRRN